MNRSARSSYLDKTESPGFQRYRKEPLFYENNYSIPVVTHPTDDEDDLIDENANMAADGRVETIMDVSSKELPPRTSTPSTRDFRFDGSSQNITITPQFDSSDRTRSEEDILNVSKDTDVSTLNQSGCEIVGIFDTSDNANSSKSSPGDIPPKDKIPYTVQFSNETTTPPSMDYSSVCNENEKQDQRISDLEKSTASLKNAVTELRQQVAYLTERLNSMQIPQNGKEGISPAKKSIFARQDLVDSANRQASERPPNFGLSKSSTTLNSRPKTDLYCDVDAQRNIPKSIPNTISKGQQNVTLPSRHPTSLNTSTIAKTPLRRGTPHASSNSLYTDIVRTNNASMSPTPSQQFDLGHRILHTGLSGKRDARTCTSMVSLGSMSSINMSTLRKESSKGSTSNLSQVGSVLTSWPSTSEFISAKNRAKEIHYSPDERLIRMMLYNTLVTMYVPRWIDFEYEVDKVIEPPPVRLKLDWVYGYRGRDCRCNLFHLPTGECVYCVASIIVLYNPEQRTQRHYLGHNDTVKCLAVHPNKLIIASGQSAAQDKVNRRPIVRVWNTVSLATLRIITFNEDFDRPICCLAFSKHDCGATLAVVDESNEHTITLLDWQRTKNWRIAEANSGHEPVFAIDFHPIDKYSLVAVGKSSVNFWDIRGMTMSKKAGLFDKYDKPKYVLCLAFNDLGETITGDSNGSIMIWPRGSNRPRSIIPNAHPGGVFSVIAMKDGSYLSGGRDRRIVEWDENFQQTSRVAELPEHFGGVRYITYARGPRVLIGTLKNCILLGSMDENFSLIMQGHSEAVTALAIQPKRNNYLTGGFDEQIHLFDASSHNLLRSKCLTMPATAAGYSPDENLLIIGSTLGKWIASDAHSFDILFTKSDGSGTINCVKFSSSGSYFALGSTDGQIYVYQLTEGGTKFRQIGSCVGHSGPVKEIDWTTDDRYIQTQSMNLELLHWKADNCRPLEDPRIIEDLSWFTHNCTLGFPVMGIWLDSIDSELVEHCDKSNNGDLICSVSDAGFLDVFKWPACYSQCQSRRFYGNAEKFNLVKFLPDDSKIVAIGSRSCVVTEWIVEKE